MLPTRAVTAKCGTVQEVMSHHQTPTIAQYGRCCATAQMNRVSPRTPSRVYLSNKTTKPVYYPRDLPNSVVGRFAGEVTHHRDAKRVRVGQLWVL